MSPGLGFTVRVEMQADQRGRVLVVAAKEAGDALMERLTSSGYQCASAEKESGLAQVADTLQPEVVLLAVTAKRAAEMLESLRKVDRLQRLPVLVDLGRARSAEAFKRLAVDDWIRSADEVVPRLEAALRAGRLRDREERIRLRMGMLLEITQAATSSLELEEILRIAVDKVGRVTGTDRCSVVLVEGSHARTAKVVATQEDPSLVQLDIEVMRYPELRRALETRESVVIEEAQRDPLMAEVRTNILPLGVKSILVQPLICQGDLLGALFLRVSRADASFGRDEQEFAQAVAGVLANSIRNARLHTAVKKKREDLEEAYVQRYQELNEANRRLKELNRLKDEIIAVCSHDLRAPLQVLLGHGRLLQEGPLEPQQRQSSEAMIRQGKKILGLVESLLEKGKGEAARLSIEPRVLDVAQLCRDAVNELEILAADRGVSLRADCPDSLMLIGDEVKLHEVLQNLITNAIHHARQDGEVVVSTQRLGRPDGDAAKVCVQDDGVGIPPDELHLVFDRYRHGGKGGTGLGLAICKEFVELHGGEIWAESPPDTGCIFVFTLPLAQEAPRNPRPPPAAASTPQEQPRVLVVEDEPEIAAVLSEVLRSKYRVEVARDGAEGLARAKAQRPDLVVMDVFLPKLDGLDAAMALKSSTDTARIPVILLSAHQGVAEKVRSLNLGAVDYMSKPFNAVELLNRTERALKLRQGEREQQEKEKSSALQRRTGSDPATGLHDRRGLLLRLEQEVARSRRYHRALSLAVLRPDRPVDPVPSSIADVMRKRVRHPDAISHLGGGVFAVVLPECQAEAARAVISRMLPDVEKATDTEYRSAVADVSQDSDSVEKLLEKLGAPAPEES
ncbi:His Kinase A (phospho-acceptor) domain-containing protein [Myxococcus virescens]|uniref:histidine kinase n=2 Tax=Myxococcus virescens TaxID=83456 RepID=A0ABY0N734_9BACT|nr:His Kinase A (phospho-acceptor) domain-containing protein [Myxococcus virescens]